MKFTTVILDCSFWCLLSYTVNRGGGLGTEIEWKCRPQFGEPQSIGDYQNDMVLGGNEYNYSKAGNFLKNKGLIKVKIWNLKKVAIFIFFTAVGQNGLCH